jgi:hypothetical protein
MVLCSSGVSGDTASLTWKPMPLIECAESNLICIGITADRTTLAPSETANLVAFAKDPDGDPICYTWSATGGTLWPDGAKALFDSTGLPDGDYTVTVVADDGDGHTSTCNVQIHVRSPKRV